MAFRSASPPAIDLIGPARPDWPTIMTLFTPTAPLSAAGGAPLTTDSAVRLWLDPALDRRGTRDGAWWPYSNNAAAELPGLIATVDKCLGQITIRVGLHADIWDDVPYRIPARGRQVMVDCSHGTDPHLLRLTLVGAEPVNLMVVPPDAGPDPAACSPGVHRPAELATGAPEPDDLAGWENEGGHFVDQDSEGPPRRRSSGQSDRRPAAALLRGEDGMIVADAFPLGRADRSAPTIVRLSGELDIFTSPALRSRLLGTLNSSTSLLILDLSGVSFCDASGLAVMVGIQRRARSMGTALALIAPRPFMSKLLRITGLDRSLPIMR
ncbi:STAS domain-containing protein [Nonomuraea sp. B12E4]|uniref:STAS domain-containing protein n=1 Tax=Nonomuraea sp. B12E4 TaxID=3153564 RepID=UPI00325E8D39